MKHFSMWGTGFSIVFPKDDILPSGTLASKYILLDDLELDRLLDNVETGRLHDALDRRLIAKIKREIDNG